MRLNRSRIHRQLLDKHSFPNRVWDYHPWRITVTTDYCTAGFLPPSFEGSSCGAGASETSSRARRSLTAALVGRAFAYAIRRVQLEVFQFAVVVAVLAYASIN